MFRVGEGIWVWVGKGIWVARAFLRFRMGEGIWVVRVVLGCYVISIYIARGYSGVSQCGTLLVSWGSD